MEKSNIENKSKINKKNIKIVHKGTRCNNCGMAPIAGIRYKCMECDDFNFCENSEKIHSHSHLFYKIKKNSTMIN